MKRNRSIIPEHPLVNPPVPTNGSLNFSQFTVIGARICNRCLHEDPRLRDRSQLRFRRNIHSYSDPMTELTS